MVALGLQPIAADTTVELREAFVGKYGYLQTGEALAVDTNANGNVDASSQPVSVTVGAGDIPDGATVTKALLYWGGSVAQPPAGDCAAGASDGDVLFTPPGRAAVPVSADAYYCSNANSTIDIEAYRADVTSSVGALTGTYTLGGFDALVSDGATDNASFSIVLVYGAASLEQRRIAVYDGLERFQSSSRTLSLGGFDVASPVVGSLTWWVLEGDVGGSGTETASVDGTPGVAGPLALQDGVNPVDNPMNRTINTQDPARTEAVGVDIDRFDISRALSGGDAVIELELAAGTDTWWLGAVVVGIDDSSLPEPALEVDGLSQATLYTGDGTYLSGVATDSELTAHINDPNAHGGASTVAVESVSISDADSADTRVSVGQSADFVQFHPDLFATALCEAIDYRFVDRGDGTVLDCSTGLIWLKDASCLGRGFWHAGKATGSAQAAVEALNRGVQVHASECEDYEAGMYSDWRLPTIDEMCGSWAGERCEGRGCCSPGGLIDSRFVRPAIADASGNGQWSEDRAFVGVGNDLYWSASEGWAADLDVGGAASLPPASEAGVWPVRGDR
jgi:hypothetical protein